MLSSVMKVKARNVSAASIPCHSVFLSHFWLSFHGTQWFFHSLAGLNSGPPPPTGDDWEACDFEIAARNNSGYKHATCATPGLFLRSVQDETFVLIFICQKEKLHLHYAAQNWSDDSFFLARALCLGENFISRFNMRQKLCFLARKLDLDKRKPFNIRMHALFSKMQVA